MGPQDIKDIARLVQDGIEQYKLVEDGDRILAAVSGGKDSLTMLYFLREIQKRAEIRFELTAVHIKTDFHCSSCVHQEVLTKFFDQMEVPYLFKHIKVLDENRQTNCFWCSWNRRKCIFETSKELGCNKVAFGHHKDDAIETTLLNLFFKGEFSTMMPRQELFGGAVKVIRPLWLVEESVIRTFAQESGFPHQLCRCPFGIHSERKAMKELIKGLSEESPGIDIRSNILNSLKRLKSAKHQPALLTFS